ncbi:MAG: helicase [Eubacterium sp.]|nr:helicase [Eubacterium sp.]
MDYEGFIESKAVSALHTDSIQMDADDLNPKLYSFQRDIVRWALAKGRAAIFADCGLGKTPMQLEWADRVVRARGGMVLILAPLAVASQTVSEGTKFGITVNLCETADDLKPGINITNYEKLGKFENTEFTGVVLDESSILKSFSGKVRSQIIDFFSNTPFRLACTATPAPNDYMELGNHAEFLGIMSYTEMLAMFFVHDGGQTSKWRLKGHAEDVFWEWMGSWAVVMESPSDLGYEIEGYDLPELRIHEIIADGDEPITEAMTLTQRRQARRDTLAERCEAAAALVNNSTEQWLVWCDLNAESDTLHKMIESSVEVKGSDKNTDKTNRMLGFSIGAYRSLVTKPSIAGFGMNWQQCHNMIFVGLSDSYEQYYQAVRRCWRFGQTAPVDVYIIISAKEGTVKENIARKEADSIRMKTAMIEQTKEITKKELKTTCRLSTPYEPTVRMMLPPWEEMSYECA